LRILLPQLPQLLLKLPNSIAVLHCLVLGRRQVVVHSTYLLLLFHYSLLETHGLVVKVDPSRVQVVLQLPDPVFLVLYTRILDLPLHCPDLVSLSDQKLFFVLVFDLQILVLIPVETQISVLLFKNIDLRLLLDQNLISALQRIPIPVVLHIQTRHLILQIHDLRLLSSTSTPKTVDLFIIFLVRKSLAFKLILKRMMRVLQ